MTEYEQALTAARARADRQVALLDSTINETLLPRARQLLVANDPTDAWAILDREIMRQLADRPQFLAELLARLALRIAEDEQLAGLLAPSTPDGPEVTDGDP